MDCIDLFKKAAAAMQTDPRYLELDAARRENDNDQELQGLIGEFNLKRLDLEETGTTFAENAKIKAEAFCKATGLPTVADDSGLCVDALNGAPGVYSARYAGEHGNDAANNEKLMAEMQNVPVGQRAAKFVSAVCLILPDGRELVVTGECPGSVALTPAGDNGFGYDPLFVPDAVGLPGGGTVPNTAHRTYAELADAEKDAISHRGRAMEKLEAELAAFLGE